MDAQPLRETVITADVCKGKDELHAHLKKTLDLPVHYGGNLSALADCLSECASPTLITIRIDADRLPTGMQAYMLRFAQVCARESLANDCVSLIVEHS